MRHRGTLDKEELIEMFEGNGVTADAEDVNDLIRAANGLEAGAEVTGDMEVTFEAFKGWMQSSSLLADSMRHALGGMLDDQLDIDGLGIEERELWALDGGWVYVGESGKQTIFIVLEESNSSRLAKLVSKLMMLLIVISTMMFILEVSG
jgi:hypothetical protein